jgi:hypothetical protein
MNPKSTKLIEEDRRNWMPPQTIDMVHPVEEVGKGTIVLLTALMMCCRALLAETGNANCNRGEWDLIVIPIIVIYLLIFFGCLGHDVWRLRKRARGSMRRRIAIARLIAGAGTTALLVYSLALKPKRGCR